MTTRNGWDEGSADGGPDISGWETRTTRPGERGGANPGLPQTPSGRPSGPAYSQAEPPLPPELNPRGPGPRRPAPQPERQVPRQPSGPGQGQAYGQAYGRADGLDPTVREDPGGPGGLPPELDPRGPGGGGPRPGGPARRGWSRRRKVRFTLFALVLALLVVSVGTYFWADSKLNHVSVLTDYAGRPPAGKGTNWLVIGSDSRQGLSKAQEQALHTGAAEGSRTDSMMILHVGSNGNTLMSIPRDSYVTIPAWTDSKGVKHSASKNKINAAYAFGDGPLLVKTIEYNTGLHIDHYAEIGFSGFVNVVDDLGGIHLCLDKAIVDQASGANLKAGCQDLNGTQSLAFVRERHQEASQDIARMKHQQGHLDGDAARPVRALPHPGQRPVPADGRQQRRADRSGLDVLRHEGRPGRQGQDHHRPDRECQLLDPGGRCGEMEHDRGHPGLRRLQERHDRAHLLQLIPALRPTTRTP